MLKRLVLILMIASVAGCASEKTIGLEQTVERDGLVYEVNSSAPFTGKARVFYPNGQLWQEVQIVDGKANGPVREWYENGQLGAEATLVDGKEDGLARGWSENGQLTYEKTYVDGVEQ
jgi:antitoxin component YwqK of YwqJK toxin-antitoxin module